MTLDGIFSEFCDKMVQKHLYHRAMKNLAKNELNELNEYYEAHKRNPRLLAQLEGHNMVFNDAVDGSIHVYSHLKRSVQDQIQSVVLHDNKQCQWLLAEAYEAFEDFIENLYAYIGLIDGSLWPMFDFGNISIKEIADKDYNWFHNRIKEKKDKPGSILNQFRKVFTDINDIEKSNKFGINLKLSILMIEELRHIIVHKSGVVDDQSEFRDNVLKKAGLFQNGKPKKEYARFINAFFASGEYENHITLLEIRAQKGIPPDNYIDRFDLLIGHMVSYSKYLVDRIKKHQEESSIG